MARKIENEEWDEGTSSDVSSEQKSDSGTGTKEKRKVVVINVPKRRKLLRTPSHIIRITLIWCLAIILFLLTYPFLQVTFYITEDLQVTPKAEEAYDVLATQADIDKAEKELRQALDSLAEAPKKEESKAASQSSAATQESTEGSQDSQPAEQQGGGLTREINTINYNWIYTIPEGVNEEKLIQLIDEVKQINREKYTEESIDRLNTAILKAQKVLCASVFVSQNALQMMLGGTVGEAFGSSNISLGNTFLRSFFTFALAILPMVAIFACIFDKKRLIKNIIVMICCALALADIFFTIYPYIGIGAVLTISMYILTMVINIGGFYARQQEKYIVEHPEKEAEYTAQHPHFVKALINQKSLDSSVSVSRRERERAAAMNAKKRQTKKKKGK